MSKCNGKPTKQHEEHAGEKQQSSYVDTPIYTMDKDGQYLLLSEVEPTLSMYQRALAFLKDLQPSDFD